LSDNLAYVRRELLDPVPDGQSPGRVRSRYRRGEVAVSRLHAAKRWELFEGVVRESARPNQPAPLFAAVDAALGKVVGHRLFTLMVLDQANGEAERVYTSDPVAYPVAGRKRSVDTPWFRQVILGRRHYLGRTREDLRWAFADHDLIERLGCGSVINVLAIYDDEVMGSANLLHEEHHYSDADIEDALPFVQLLVPALRSFAVEK